MTMERAFQNNSLPAGQISFVDYPSVYQTSTKRPKLWGIKPERSATHRDYFHSATPPCIELSYDLPSTGNSSSMTSHVHRKQRSSKPLWEINTHKRSATGRALGDTEAAIRSTSASMSRDIINIYSMYAKHTASEQNHIRPTSSTWPHTGNTKHAITPSASGAAITRSCDMVCHGGTCRRVLRLGSKVTKLSDGFKCKTFDEDRYSGRYAGHVPLPSLAFDSILPGMDSILPGMSMTNTVCLGSERRLPRHRCGLSEDDYGVGGSSYGTQLPFERLRVDTGDSHVVCNGGQCQLKSESSQFQAPAADNYDIERDHHPHRQSPSRPWSRDDDDAWPDGGSNVEHSYSSLSPSARSRPSFDDDHDNWKVLADLGHRGLDKYPDGNSTREDQRTVGFSDGSYDENSRRYGWRFDVPGDPYCLKRQHIAERPTFYSPPHPSDSDAEPRPIGYQWDKTNSNCFFQNTRPPRKPREYFIHPDLASERMCPTGSSRNDQHERTKRRHLDAAKMMRDQHQQQRRHAENDHAIIAITK